MQKLAGLLLISVLLTSCSHTYYIVRHAEKAVPSAGTTMSTPDDPPLSEDGSARAQALKTVLMNKGVKNIFSTNTKRTRATAQPISDQTGVAIQTYGPRPDSSFINRMKGLHSNTLIVGHSNTVDDVVNGLLDQKKLTDLADSEYDNLYVIKYKRFFGKRVKFDGRKY